MNLRLLIALGAVFVVFPCSASAANDPDLTYPTGTMLGTGSKVRADNVGDVKFTTDEGTYVCSYWGTTGTLTKNSGTEFEANVETAAVAGKGAEDKCTTSSAPIGDFKLTPSPSTNGLPWCIRSTAAMKEDEVQIRGGSCGGEAKPIRITFDVKAPSFYCIYERAAAIKGTYATHPEDALLTTTGVETNLVRGTVTCPTVLKSDTVMTVEADKEVNEPTYISAGPKLTFPTGTLLAPGSKLRATNVGIQKFTSSTGESLYECSSNQWTGTLTKNSGTEVEADIETASITGTGAGSSCTTSFGSTKWTLSPFTNGLPWCFRATSAMAADEFQIRGGKCTEAAKPMRFLWESVSEIEAECAYERGSATPINATYTTHPENAKLTINEAEFTKLSGAVSCPPSFKLDSTLTLERDNTPGSVPLYIS